MATRDKICVIGLGIAWIDLFAIDLGVVGHHLPMHLHNAIVSAIGAGTVGRIVTGALRRPKMIQAAVQREQRQIVDDLAKVRGAATYAAGAVAELQLAVGQLRADNEALKRGSGYADGVIDGMALRGVGADDPTCDLTPFVSGNVRVLRSRGR